MSGGRPISASSAAPRARSLKTARLIAGGFIAAFATSILTVVYTGLHVGAPRGPKMGGTPARAPASVSEPTKSAPPAVERDDAKRKKSADDDERPGERP